MASAGRILIMPKGDYNAETTYEMLDLVFNGGASWVAKKTSVGIEPSEANVEYWMKMCEATDLTEIENRLKTLENEETDLSGYALKSEVETVNEKVDTVEENVSALTEDVDTLTEKVGTMEQSLNDSSSDNLNVLDYDNAVEKDALYNLPYTCPSAGEVTVYVVPSSAAGLVGLKIDKNDYPVAYITSYGGDYIASTFPVAEGDIINKNGSAVNVTSATVTFRPYK